MRFFYKGKDGGPESPVTGYWLIEIKSLFSIVLLKFEDGTRETYHTHAFNAFTWFIKGELWEERIFPKMQIRNLYIRSLFPKYTQRDNLHRVCSKGVSWCFSIRGPWSNYWTEYNDKTGETISLTNGRKIVR